MGDLPAFLGPAHSEICLPGLGTCSISIANNDSMESAPAAPTAVPVAVASSATAVAAGAAAGASAASAVTSTAIATMSGNDFCIDI